MFDEVCARVVMKLLICGCRRLLQEVNEMWAGLGYYRRARFLLEVSSELIDHEFMVETTGIGMGFTCSVRSVERP